MHKLAIVGTFYDGYYDLWEDFLELFYTNWPDCPYPLYIVNDEKELSFKKEYKVNVIHAGHKAEYSQRVQTAVKEIDADYYLLLLEDFFIGRKLSANVIDDVMKFIVNNDLKYYRMPLGEFTPFYKKGKIEKILPSSEYTVSCQPSIWRKDFLKSCIGDQVYNAWIFEGIYTKAPKAHTEEFLEGCYVDYRNLLSLYHGAIQSKFLNSTVKVFQKDNYTFKAKLPMMNKKDENAYKIKYLLICLCPLKIRQMLKNKKNNTSVLAKYSDEIERIIQEYELG